MLKKLFTLITAAAISLSLATSSFAAFENFHLIRVVSDKTGGSTLEIATDLGDITALAALSNTTVGGGGDAFIIFNSNPFANLSVNYFAVNRTNALNGTMYIGANTPSAPATGGIAAIQNKLSITSANAPPTPMSVNKYYSTLPLEAGSSATVIANNLNASSLSGMFGSTTLGSYANYTGTWSSNANLALTNLTATAPIAMTVWQFGPGNMAAQFTGVRVLDLATNADGSTTINPTITKTDQAIGAITFTPATLAVNGTTAASATATSGLPVTFTSTTPDVCTVSGATITGITTGTCTIAADQAGDTTFNAAPRVTRDINVDRGSQTIGAIAFDPATLAVVGATTASATATSGLPVTFSSKTGGVCTVSGATVTGVSAGTCTIAADQGGDASYNAAPQVTQDITVAKGSQTISSISFTPNSVNVGDTTTASATATSGLPVTFTSATVAVCTVGPNGSTITINTSGTCIIAADQAGNVDYNAATQVTQSITAGLAGQTITFTNPGVQVIGTTPTLTATATSGLAPAFTSSTPGVCTITSGGALSFVATGTCIIAADQSGNANFNAAPPITQSFSVGKGSQTIGPITVNPASLTVGVATAASATATSGLAVTFSSTTPAVCTVNGSTVTGISTGTCTIAADQAGDANYSMAPQVTQSFAVVKGSQTIGPITFNSAALAVGGSTTASATATSGLAVIFSSTTPAVCTVSGSTVTGVSAGTCTIAADQVGDTTYNAAPQVTKSINTSILTIPFTVTTKVDGSGSISPQNPQVPANATATFSVTPSQGYQIAKVTGCNGTWDSTTSTYTTGRINSICTVTAVFAQSNTTTPKNSLTIAEALLALKIAVGLIQSTPEQFASVNVAPIGNPDSKIDIADAVAILQYAVGNLSHL